MKYPVCITLNCIADSLAFSRIDDQVSDSRKDLVAFDFMSKRYGHETYFVSFFRRISHPLSH